MKIFKIFWSENGDYLKFQYSGTLLNNKSVTFKGGENYIEKIYNHKVANLGKYIKNFNTFNLQQSIDTLLLIKSEREKISMLYIS